MPKDVIVNISAHLQQPFEDVIAEATDAVGKLTSVQLRNQAKRLVASLKSLKTLALDQCGAQTWQRRFVEGDIKANKPGGKKTTSRKK